MAFLNPTSPCQMVRWINEYFHGQSVWVFWTDRLEKMKKGQGIQSAVGIARPLTNTVADDDGVDGA